MKSAQNLYKLPTKRREGEKKTIKAKVIYANVNDLLILNADSMLILLQLVIFLFQIKIEIYTLPTMLNEK